MCALDCTFLIRLFACLLRVCAIVEMFTGVFMLTCKLGVSDGDFLAFGHRTQGPGQTHTEESSRIYDSDAVRHSDAGFLATQLHVADSTTQLWQPNQTLSFFFTQVTVDKGHPHLNVSVSPTNDCMADGLQP